MNERLTIRNPHFEIFRWLPIGRCDIGHGSGQRLPDGGPGVMSGIKGNIGAERLISAMLDFSSQGPRP
jgi:hypothetical protein